ncbi:MFS transporter [Saxibacter everestensis]|uniref:MFS transporter n=1 Tax=Saxibacter everestensis TaxID=2909229 RepID=A0ABY8QQK2_9MICO|nr:MFS transporter [Brevibacteriaceae bacterium ZFBP1038]
MHHFRRNQALLIVAQLFSGVGIASGVAVGGLLSEEVSGTTSAAGFGQTATVLGAGLVAMPLARMAGRHSRRWALTIGFGIGALGAAIILLAAASTQFWLLLIGMLCFGSATAAGLQSRYAAAELAPPATQARAMSIVVWATTLGTVAGPNLSEPGSRLGQLLGMNHLVGPYLFAVVSFGLAALVVACLRTSVPSSRRPAQAGDTVASSVPVEPGKPVGTAQALREAISRPNALFALVTIIGGHMMMVSVMVMTPIHMNHGGMSLELVGIVISVHVLGMYAASPLFGWLADKIGARTTALTGAGIFAIAIVVGLLDATSGHSSMGRISIALGILGLGWSCCLIGGSALLNQSIDEEARVPLQGASDAMMNFGAAIMAALAGPVLANGGFLWINLMAALILLPLILLGVRAVAIGRRSSLTESAAEPASNSHRS